MIEARHMGLVLWVGTLGSCALSGEPHLCDDPPPEGMACCDEAIYERVRLTTLAANSGAYMDQRVEITGMADGWGTVQDWVDCVCVGDICNCPRVPALRSLTCGTAVALGGTYRGQVVECTSVGCYPLQPLINYGVCGVWNVGALGGEGFLAIEGLCLRP